MTGDRISSKEYLKKVNEVPFLKKEATAFLQRPENQPLAADAPDALLASIVEFILEGLHVENRLNKNMRGGEAVFKR